MTISVSTLFFSSAMPFPQLFAAAAFKGKGALLPRPPSGAHPAMPAITGATPYCVLHTGGNKCHVGTAQIFFISSLLSSAACYFGICPGAGPLVNFSPICSLRRLCQIKSLGIRINRNEFRAGCVVRSRMLPPAYAMTYLDRLFNFNIKLDQQIASFLQQI